MAVGDLSELVCTVGPLDFVNDIGTTLMELNIYEDMESPTGPFGDVLIVDGVNALDRANITGNEPVTVTLSSNDFNSSASFKMSLMQGVNYKPGSERGADGASGGSLYHKEYTLKFCAPEFVTCQGNYVNGEFEKACSDIVRDIVTIYFPSSSFSCPDPTRFTRRMIARYEHPLKFLNRVIDDSINNGSNPSSLYVLYKNRTGFIYETYENAFKRRSGQSMKLMNTLRYQASDYQDKIRSLMWVEGEAFYRPSRPQNKSYVVTYNMDSGEVTNAQVGTDIGKEFKVLGEYIYTKSPNPTVGIPVFHIISAENNPEPFELAEAKRRRLAFQSHLMQNTITFCCVGNPNINIGSVVSIIIPDDFPQQGQEGVEEQLSIDFCVTAINHKVRGINMTPRYIMICRAVKAAFATEGDVEG